MVPRVLAENLARLLGTDDVLTLPTRRPMPLDYQVEVEVLRRHADPAGSAVLDARWRVFDRDDNLVGSDRSTIREDVAQPGDYRAPAAAMSRALGTLSRDIATAIGSSTACRARSAGRRAGRRSSDYAQSSRRPRRSPSWR